MEILNRDIIDKFSVWVKGDKIRYYIDIGHYTTKSSVYFTRDKTDVGTNNIIMEFDNGIIVAKKTYNGAVKDEIEKYIKLSKQEGIAWYENSDFTHECDYVNGKKLF